MLTTCEFIPNTLKALPNWVLWKLEERDGRLTKVPYSALYNGKASSTNSSTWYSFDVAQSAYTKNPLNFSGLGFVLSKENHIIFTDIDHCFTADEKLNEQATDILKTLPNQFVEISQSGSGLHIISLGSIERSFKNPQKNVEMYDSKRFVAITGKSICPFEPHEDQLALDCLFLRYCSSKINQVNIAHPREQLLKSDKRIIELGMKKEKFRALFSGNWEQMYHSHSEADLAFCIMLAFWTDSNQITIDRIFRSSKLYRAKWERADYRTKTIDYACSICSQTISELINSTAKRKGARYEEYFLSSWARS